MWFAPSERHAPVQGRLGSTQLKEQDDPDKLRRVFDPVALQEDASAASRAVEAAVPEPARSEAGPLIAWSAVNLRAAQVGLRIAQGSGANPRGILAQELGEEADMLHIAALSLGFGDIASGLDICAGAAGVLTGIHPAAPRIPDVDWWTAPRLAQLKIPEFANWLQAVQGDVRWGTITYFRHPITH